MNLGATLHAAGFGTAFLETHFSPSAHLPGLPKGLLTPGYVLLLDQPESQRLVLADFANPTQDIRSWIYQPEEEEEEEEQEMGSLGGIGVAAQSTTDGPLAPQVLDLPTALDSECKQLATLPPQKRSTSWVVGAGVHSHANGALWVIQELAALTSNSLLPGLRTTRKVALISLQSISHLQQYIKALQQTLKLKPHLNVFIHVNDDWSFDRHSKVSPDSIFIGPLWKTLESEIRNFLSPQTRAWYRSKGVTYARSMLFHGPPGNGKSKTIRALGSHFQLPLYILNLNDAKLSDEGLMRLVREIEDRAFLVLEDIDRVFDHFSTNIAESHVSFATLLNILDGTLTREGVMVIMTANNIEHMDDAMKRCGRISSIHQFDTMSSNTAQEMFLSYYPGAKEEARQLAVTWKKHSDQVSGALLQEHLILHRDKPATEACRLEVEPHQKKRKRTVHNLML